MEWSRDIIPLSSTSIFHFNLFFHLEPESKPSTLRKDFRYDKNEQILINT